MNFNRVDRHVQDDTEFLRERLDTLLGIIAKLVARLKEFAPNDPLVKDYESALQELPGRPR